MADTNLSQELSSKHDHLQDTLLQSQQVEGLLQHNTEAGNFTTRDQRKFDSESTNLYDTSDDSALENKISDMGSFSRCERVNELVEKNEKSSRGFEDSVFVENVLLETKKKKLLEEVEAGSIFKNEAFVKEIGSCLNGKAGTLEGFNDSVKGSLSIQMVDDTALIEPLKSCVGDDSNKVLETSERQKNETYVYGELSDGCVQMKYTRKEMEDLRFVNVVEKKKMWRNIFAELRNDVVQQYKALTTNSKAQKNNRFNSDQRLNHGRREDPPNFLGELSSKSVDSDLQNSEKDETGNINVMEPSCPSNIEAEDTCLFSEGEGCDDEYDSDEDYASIQKPAFFVEGEPDFDSGPPEDGLEYLRRVRWEASHIPKVKVAKRDRKVNEEQSVYMPQIPDIAKCPDHLLPLKEWENAFLADFSKLRELLSRDEGSGGKISSKEDTSSSQLADRILVFDNLVMDQTHFCDPHDDLSHEKPTDEQSNAESDDGKTLTSSENLTPKNIVTDSLCSYPTLTAILSMDSVARVSTLRKRINAAATADVLSKDDCVWLFSLCAAVDTPLDADTSAALRSLLRKCASLRAAKSEVDDEVIMLNILATISGRFFGQSEC